MRNLLIAATALAVILAAGCGANEDADETLAAETTTTTTTTTTTSTTTLPPTTVTTTTPPGAPCAADAYREGWRRGTGATAELLVSDDRCNGTWALVNVLQGPNRTSFLVGFRAKGNKWNMIEAAKSGVDDEYVATLLEAGFPKSLLAKWGQALDGSGSPFAGI